jgi:hypothetical protein
MYSVLRNQVWRASQGLAGSKTLNCGHDFSQCASLGSDSVGIGARRPTHGRPCAQRISDSGSPRLGGGWPGCCTAACWPWVVGRASALWFCACHVGHRLAGGRRVCRREPDFPATAHPLDLVRLGAVAVLLALFLSRQPHASGTASAWLALHLAFGVACYGLFGIAVVHAWFMTRPKPASGMRRTPTVDCPC